MPFYVPDLGGIESLGAALHPRMAARNVEVTVIAGPGPHSDPGMVEVDGIVVHRLELRSLVESGEPRRIARGARAVSEIRKEVSPHLIHIHLSGPEVLFHLATGRSSLPPLLITVHNTPSALGLGGADGLYRSALDSAAWVSAVSEPILDEVRELRPDLADRSSLIENGIELVDPPEAAPAVGHFAVIGRLVEQKAPEIAVEALAEVRAAGHDARLTIAGDGPLRGPLEELVGSLDLHESVDFAGVLTPAEVRGLLQTTTALLMPSLWEGLPMAAIEAGGAGVPTLASRVGGLATLVSDGVTGRSLRVADPPALAAAMAELVTDPELGRAWGAAAQRRIETRYGIDRCVDEYVALYQQIGHGA